MVSLWNLTLVAFHFLLHDVRHSMVMPQYVLHLYVEMLRYRDHIGWNTSNTVMIIRDAEANFLRAECSSSHPTKSIKALKDYSVKITTATTIINKQKHCINNIISLICGDINNHCKSVMTANSKTTINNSNTIIISQI